MLVKATREGLIGNKTASGFVVDAIVPFVALPSRNAIGRFVRIINHKNQKSCIAIVLDVGPWNTNDDAYVFSKQRPLSERGVSVSMRGTNNAGIDLSEKVWNLLGMTGNDDVDWEFLD